MFTQFRYSKSFTLLRVVSVLILFALLASPIAAAKASQSQADAPIKDVKSLLDNYSLYLNTGATSHKASYAPAMASLIQERQEFYAEYFKTGLHLNLNTLESSFLVDDSKTLMASDGATHITVLELVTMNGSPIIKTAEEYPMILAAKWAISKSDNKVVQEQLKQYIEATTVGANESISNGVEITFRVNHNIDIINKAGQLQIISDGFTDKEIDNGEGIDNVTWVDGNPVRSHPDYTRMADYSIYNTPIEVLGQQLLDDYTNAYGGDASHNITPAFAGNFSYNRTAAQNYALSYVNPNSFTPCPYDYSVLMDTSYYGPLYQSIWGYTTTTCNDCANYISQALRAGGFLSDSFWNSNNEIGSYAWRMFDFTSGSQPGLAYYLNTTKQAIDDFSSYISLSIGDLMFISYPHPNYYHVVMVTGIVPVRYSGHTNDRRNYPYMSVLDIFWHIKSFPQSYTFMDVPPTYWAWQEIERLYSNAITSGCGTNPLNYCPGNEVTRAQMAVFLLRGIHGSSYIPPEATGAMFSDVPQSHWAGAFIEELANEGITVGCGGGTFCPDQSVTHAQMAVFLLRSKYTSDYIPPAVGSSTGFWDVPTNYWAATYVKQLALVENISYGAHGCSPYYGYYCPDNPVTRAEMAGMILRTFNNWTMP